MVQYEYPYNRTVQTILYGYGAKPYWQLEYSNDHFQLHSLYCDNTLDLSQIINSQTELQILGIYEYYDNEVRFLETLKWLRNAQLHLPVVVTLELNYYREFYKNSIFPAFFSVDRHPTIHRLLAETFDKDQSSYLFAGHCVGKIEISINVKI